MAKLAMAVSKYRETGVRNSLRAQCGVQKRLLLKSKWKKSLMRLFWVWYKTPFVLRDTVPPQVYRSPQPGGMR